MERSRQQASGGDIVSDTIRSKLELVIAVCTREWKKYMDELDRRRPISLWGDSAIDRLIFTLDGCIALYMNYKELFLYNDT